MNPEANDPSELPPRLLDRVSWWGRIDRTLRCLIFHSEGDRQDFHEHSRELLGGWMPDCPMPINPDENPFPGVVLVDQRSRAEARQDARGGITLAQRAHTVVRDMESVKDVLQELAPTEHQWRPVAPAYPLQIAEG